MIRCDSKMDGRFANFRDGIPRVHHQKRVSGSTQVPTGFVGKCVPLFFFDQ
jgi:hypothetical protein